MILFQVTSYIALGEKLIGDVALIVTAIGVLGVLLSLRQSYKERLRQFEAMYVQRYWKIMDQLSLDALKGSSSDELIESDNKAIRSYILLSDDELEMRKNGYIADSTYVLWADGIRSQLGQPMFAKIWKQIETEVRKHDPLPYIHLRRLLGPESVKDCDPLKASWWRHRLRGLSGSNSI